MCIWRSVCPETVFLPSEADQHMQPPMNDLEWLRCPLLQSRFSRDAVTEMPGSHFSACLLPQVIHTQKTSNGKHTRSLHCDSKPCEGFNTPDGWIEKESKKEHCAWIMRWNWCQLARLKWYFHHCTFKLQSYSSLMWLQMLTQQLKSVMLTESVALAHCNTITSTMNRHNTYLYKKWVVRQWFHV